MCLSVRVGNRIQWPFNNWWTFAFDWWQFTVTSWTTAINITLSQWTFHRHNFLRFTRPIGFTPFQLLRPLLHSAESLFTVNWWASNSDWLHKPQEFIGISNRYSGRMICLGHVWLIKLSFRIWVQFHISIFLMLPLTCAFGVHFLSN